MIKRWSTWKELVGRIGRRSRSTTAILLISSMLAIGAGAAVGVVTGGDIGATIPITVSQSLVGEKPDPYNFPSGRKFFSSISDDKTKFSVALEMFRAESLTVLVPLLNRSSGNTVAEFSVVIPNIPSSAEGTPGLSVRVAGSGLVDDVAQISSNIWTFTADAHLNGSSSNPADGLLITFTVARTASSGFFEITGHIQTEEF